MGPAPQPEPAPDPEPNQKSYISKKANQRRLEETASDEEEEVIRKKTVPKKRAVSELPAEIWLTSFFLEYMEIGKFVGM